MKSTAKKKLFINNMITLGMSIAAWITWKCSWAPDMYPAF